MFSDTNHFKSGNIISHNWIPRMHITNDKINILKDGLFLKRELFDISVIFDKTYNRIPELAKLLNIDVLLFENLLSRSYQIYSFCFYDKERGFNFLNYVEVFFRMNVLIPVRHFICPFNFKYQSLCFLIFAIDFKKQNSTMRTCYR